MFAFNWTKTKTQVGNLGACIWFQTLTYACVSVCVYVLYRSLPVLSSGVPVDTRDRDSLATVRGRVVDLLFLPYSAGTPGGSASRPFIAVAK